MSRILSPRSMSHDDQARAAREPHQEVSLLILRMVWISDGTRERIAEGGHGLVEGHAVLPKVLTSFFGVPLEGKRQRLLPPLRRSNARSVPAAQRIGAQLPGPPPWLPEAPELQCQTLPKVDWIALLPGQLQRLVGQRFDM